MRYVNAAVWGVSLAVWGMLAWIWLLAWSTGAVSRIGRGAWEHSDMEIVFAHAALCSVLPGPPILFFAVSSKATRSTRLGAAIFGAGFILLLCHLPLFE